jgi:hypothetical protein
VVCGVVGEYKFLGRMSGVFVFNFVSVSFFFFWFIG